MSDQPKGLLKCCHCRQTREPEVELKCSVCGTTDVGSDGLHIQYEDDDLVCYFCYCTRYEGQSDEDANEAIAKRRTLLN